MDNLYLADLAGLTEELIKAHIASEYAGDKMGFGYGCPSAADKEALAETLTRFDVVIAYESVGEYGCDSASWFLLREKATGAYFEFSGGHCSCYGFEGQFSLDPVGAEYLRGPQFSFPAGGYDRQIEGHRSAVKAFLKAL